MNIPRIKSLTVLIIGAVMAALDAGCVSSSTYEQAQKKAYAQHEQDQRQILDLSVGNKRLKERVEELESSLQSTREQLARTEAEWKEMRDEALKLKIEKEQQSGRRHDRFRNERAPADILDENARLRDRLEDARRRIRELLQQLQQMLEPF